MEFGERWTDVPSRDVEGGIPVLDLTSPEARAVLAGLQYGKVHRRADPWAYWLAIWLVGFSIGLALLLVDLPKASFVVCAIALLPAVLFAMEMRKTLKKRG